MEFCVKISHFRTLSCFQNSRAVPDDDSEYAASRYVPILRTILEDLARNALSLEEYPSVLPMPESASSPSSAGGSSARGARSARSSRKDVAGSARKSGGATSRWAKSSISERKGSTGPTNLSGPRCLVFMMGGLSYTELKTARDVMSKESREVVIGSTAFLSASDFIDDLTILGREDE